MRRTESVNTAYAWPQPYAPQNTAVQLPATSHIDSCIRTTLTLPILPREASVTDADLPESDRSTPFHYASGEKKQLKDLPEVDEGPDGKAHQNSTTDLSEDDQSADSGSPAHGSSNADCSEDGQELLITEPAAGTLVKSSRRWADLSEDEEIPAFQDTKSSVDQKVLTEAPAKAARRWADLSEDEQTPAFQDTKSLVDQKILRVASAKADLSEDEQTRFQQKTQPASISAAVGKKRWADVSEDDWSETDSRNNARMGEMTESDNEQDGPDEQDLFDKTEPSSLISTIDDDKESQPGVCNKKDVTRVGFRPSRPQFSRPTREARVRQFQAKMDEIFELNFDEVDPSQQDGLTHRILVGLKSLGEMVSFWPADGTQTSEEGFKLLGLKEEDMYALGRIIRKADKLLDERRFREAYDKLSTAQRWFDPESLMQERAKASTRDDKKSAKKDKKKACDLEENDESDEWTQVKKKDKKKEKRNSSDELCKKDIGNGTWKQAGGKNHEHGKWEQAGRKNFGKTTNSKPDTISNSASIQSSSLKPQSLTLKPQASLRPQASATRPQGKKAPQKMLCRYNVCVEQDRAFNVVRKLLGDKGSHMKQIAENTGAKLRIRGRGSGFLEGPDQTEASDEPLMLCISATSREGFEAAVEDVESLLGHVQEQYRDFCKQRNLPVPNMLVTQREQPANSGAAW